MHNIDYDHKFDILRIREDGKGNFDYYGDTQDNGYITEFRDFNSDELKGFEICYLMRHCLFGNKYNEYADKIKFSDEIKMGNFTQYNGYTGTIEYSKIDKIFYGKLNLKNDFVSYHADDLPGLYEEFKKAVDDYIDMKSEIDTSEPKAQLHNTQEFIKKYYSNILCINCNHYLCKLYGGRCRKYRFYKFFKKLTRR